LGVMGTFLGLELRERGSSQKWNLNCTRGQYVMSSRAIERRRLMILWFQTESSFGEVHYFVSRLRQISERAGSILLAKPHVGGTSSSMQVSDLTAMLLFFQPSSLHPTALIMLRLLQQGGKEENSKPPHITFPSHVIPSLIFSLMLWLPCLHFQHTLSISHLTTF